MMGGEGTWDSAEARFLGQEFHWLGEWEVFNVTPGKKGLRPAELGSSASQDGQ